MGAIFGTPCNLMFTSINLSITSEGSFRDFSIDWVVFTRYSGNRFEQHVKSWISGSITSVTSQFLFSSVDRNIVRGSSITTSSGSVVTWCNVATRSKPGVLASSATS